MKAQNSILPRPVPLLLSLVFSGLCLQSQAQDKPLLAIDLSVCAAVVELSARLSCFDDLAKVQAQDAMSESKETLMVVAVPKETAQETVTDIEQFGKATIEKDQNGEEEFVDQVASIKELTPNKKTLTLSSGQVWRQMVAKRLYIRKDDIVRIKKKGSRKSFQLTVEGRSGFIQVERVQ